MVVNKGRAARKFLELSGLSDATLYAAGDGATDLALRESANFFFAPEMAQPFVKERADFIFPSPSDGGLALALKMAIKPYKKRSTPGPAVRRGAETL